MPPRVIVRGLLRGHALSLTLNLDLAYLNQRGMKLVPSSLKANKKQIYGHLGVLAFVECRVTDRRSDARRAT